MGQSTRVHRTKKRKLDIGHTSDSNADSPENTIPRSALYSLFQIHLNKCTLAAIKSKGLPIQLQVPENIIRNNEKDTVKELWIVFLNSTLDNDEQLQFPKMPFITKFTNVKEDYKINSEDLTTYLHYSFILLFIQIACMWHRLPIFLSDIVR